MLGFGLERIVMALFKTHGFDPEKWPAQVRSRSGIRGLYGTR